MKYKLLAISTEEVVNIGDYIQALAASIHLPRIDGFIQRERLKDYHDEEATVIMNGWFMHHPEQWPPSEKIHPLFTAFHLNTLAQETILSAKGISYLKEYEPVGCRDRYTQQLLASKGIRAYFSGCLTLTLGEKYRYKGIRKGIVFVDPFFETRWSAHTLTRNALTLLRYWKTISKIAGKHPDSHKGIKKKMIVTTFFREYRKFFSTDSLVNGEFICQQSHYYKERFKTDEERLQEAERLVMKYAKAQIVVTSRIHCALPCLGLETPVIFIDNESQSEASACRMSGLKELFNILSWKNGHLVSSGSSLSKTKMDKEIPHNKNDWRELVMRIEAELNGKLKQE